MFVTNRSGKTVADDRSRFANKCKRWGCSVLALLLGICCLVFCCWLFTFLWNYFGVPFDGLWVNAGVLVVAMEIALICILVLSLSKILPLKTDETFLESIAGKPDPSNWNWQGGTSLFTFVILWIVRGLRLVSVLQIAKAFYRRIDSAESDAGSTRSNVPPWFQELYVLLWGMFLLWQLIGGVKSFFLVTLDVYFIVESITWILYYSIFRRFFEDKYSIYHVMEHLPIILFIVPLQAIAYSLTCMYGMSEVSDLWKNVLPVLLGEASEHYLSFSIMGFIYSAIVVSIIISTFPVEKLKMGIPETFVIGAGSVVKERLFPALYNRIKRHGKDKVGDISIYAKESGELICGESEDGTVRVYLDGAKPRGSDLEETRYKLKSIYELMRQTSKNVVAWIETPADTHLYYLELLKNSVDFVVVEKPMVCCKSDLAVMKKIVSSDYRRKIFFLSYYLLEKALVLTFLKRSNEFYTEYFKCFKFSETGMASHNENDAKAKSEVDIGEFYKAYLELGKLKRIDVSILEPKDLRSLSNGGQLVETFLHNCLIASLFAGFPNTWENVNFIGIEDDGTAKIELNAKGELGEDIHLILEKSGASANKQQNAELVFENGKIVADFNKRRAKINEGVCLEIKEMYQAPYAVLCDMVYRCYFSQFDLSVIDGLYHQVEVLEWFLTSPIFKDYLARVRAKIIE